MYIFETLLTIRDPEGLAYVQGNTYICILINEVRVHKNCPSTSSAGIDGCQVDLFFASWFVVSADEVEFRVRLLSLEDQWERSARILYL